MSNSPKVERKLAAIVFTDIVGFTEITANDQSQSLDILNQQRELLKPLVESYNGKWLKEIGDGLLLIFDTVTDAVNCSIEIQNKTKSIDNLNLRIGIHQGEIVLQENDVIGDDVNIASRIEPFSATGGIAISNKVNDAIIREKEFQTEYIGKPKLKGVSQEIKVYCIVSHSLPKTDISQVSAKLETEKSKYNIFTLTGGVFTAIGILFWVYVSVFDISLAEESKVPSIAILPLDNKGEAEDEFYAYGLSSELISNVASAGLIRVASLKDIEKLDYKLLNNKELAEKLDIRYIVNGTLWKLDSIFQLSLEVFDTKSSKILWSESWHNKWEELTSIKNILSIKLLDNFNISNNIISHSTTNSNSQAYEYYLKGKYLYENLSSSENRKNSIKFLNKAIELDSNLVIAKLELAGIYLESPMYFEYNRIYNEKSKMLIISSLKLSTITKNQLNLSNSLKMMGDFHYYWNDNDSASYYWKKAFNIYLLINDIKGIQDCQNSLAIIAKQSGNYILADSLYNESILSGDKIGNKRYNATTYQNLGMLYNNYYFLNGKKISDLNKSSNYYKKSIQLSQESNFHTQLMSGYTFLVANNMILDLYENAIKYSNKSYKIAVNIENNFFQEKNLLNIGKLYIKIGNYEEAFKILENEIFQKSDNIHFKLLQFLNLSIYYYLNNDFKTALSYLIKIENEEELNKDSAQYRLFLYLNEFEMKIYKYLTMKKLALNFNYEDINKLVAEEEYINFELNFRLYELLEEKSYLETAFGQVQEKADAMEDEIKEKFLNYPIPKQIIEEYNKVFK